MRRPTHSCRSTRSVLGVWCSGLGVWCLRFVDWGFAMWFRVKRVVSPVQQLLFLGSEGVGSRVQVWSLAHLLPDGQVSRDLRLRV